MDHGPPMDRGPPMDHGPPVDRRQPINRGPPMDCGQPMDRGSGHGGRPDRPSSGGQRMGGGGGESPRNYRHQGDDRERTGTGGRPHTSSQPPRGGGDYGGPGGRDYGGGGAYPRRQHEPQRIPEWERRDDRHMSRPDEYQGGGHRPAATHSEHGGSGHGGSGHGGPYGGGGGKGRMDDYRGTGRQFNPGGERRDYHPQQPQPYVDFTPLQRPPPKEGGAGIGRRGNDLNDLNQPRGQSGGGELFM